MAFFKKISFKIKVIYRLFYNDLKSLTKAVTSGSIFKDQKKAIPEVRVQMEIFTAFYTAKKFVPNQCKLKEAKSLPIIIETMFKKPPIGVEIIQRQFDTILNSKVN